MLTGVMWLLESDGTVPDPAHIKASKQ